MIKIATGYYINYYTPLGGIDLFVIFNEPNGIPDQETIDAVDQVVRNYLNHKEYIDPKQLEMLLENVVEFGVQVFINEH